MKEGEEKQEEEEKINLQSITATVKGRRRHTAQMRDKRDWRVESPSKSLHSECLHCFVVLVPILSLFLITGRKQAKQGSKRREKELFSLSLSVYATAAVQSIIDEQKKEPNISPECMNK